MLKRIVDSVTLVSEDEIVDGFTELGRSGFNAEPTSAVVLPAVRKLNLPAGESVLVILTGSGLKHSKRDV